MKTKSIRIVLLETSHPGNIGAAARAMKNMGLTELALVNPADYPSATATARAAGADDILQYAKVCGSLSEALEGVTLVFGASARTRAVDWPQVDARECGKMVASSSHASIALLFGRESSGLTNPELDCCHYLTHIPTNENYSSLNVASAVQVLSYEVRMALIEQGNISHQSVEKMEQGDFAGHEETEHLYAHMEGMLRDVGFFEKKYSPKLMRRVRRLFNRYQLHKREVRILRGMLSAIQRKFRG